MQYPLLESFVLLSARITEFMGGGCSNLPCRIPPATTTLSELSSIVPPPNLEHLAAAEEPTVIVPDHYNFNVEDQDQAQEQQQDES